MVKGIPIPGAIGAFTWLASLAIALSASAAPTVPAKTSSPRCHNEGYAPVKNGVTAYPTPTATATGDDLQENDSKILNQDSWLAEPPEVSRIRHGWVSHWVGAFINDGLESWTAVDLDRSIIISVQRHIFLRHAGFTRPIHDPLFTEHSGNLLFARKYTSTDGTALEVVSISGIDAIELEAFVCVANAEWASPASPIGPPMISDTLASASTLLDERQSAGTSTMYSKPADGGPVSATLNGAWRNLPHVKW